MLSPGVSPPGHCPCPGFLLQAVCLAHKACLTVQTCAPYLTADTVNCLWMEQRLLSPSEQPGTHRPGPLLDNTLPSRKIPRVRGGELAASSPHRGGGQAHLWTLWPQVGLAQGWMLQGRQS